MRIKKILIIDDEKDITLGLKTWLESSGHNVISAFDGEKGLELAKVEKPNMIILDVSMPKMDGWQVLMHLKKDPQTRWIPVLMCTVRKTIEEFEKAFAMGAEGYIIKPFELEKLHNELKDLAEKSIDPIQHIQQGDSPKRALLIVDDEKPFANGLKEVLEMEGFSCSVASGGKEAIDMLESSRPDLILLDIKMPHPDGYETLTTLKNKDKTKDLPVIMVTSCNQERDKNKAMSLGASDYVTKPFELTDLVRRIRKVL